MSEEAESNGTFWIFSIPLRYGYKVAKQTLNTVTEEVDDLAETSLQYIHSKCPEELEKILSTPIRLIRKGVKRIRGDSLDESSKNNGETSVQKSEDSTKINNVHQNELQKENHQKKLNEKQIARTSIKNKGWETVAKQALIVFVKVSGINLSQMEAAKDHVQKMILKYKRALQRVRFSPRSNWIIEKENEIFRGARQNIKTADGTIGICVGYKAYGGQTHYDNKRKRMHHFVDDRCFKTTVFVPNREEEQLLLNEDTSFISEAHNANQPCTPNSFPCTPNARSKVMNNYDQFTSNTLLMAREKLNHALNPSFSKQDSHPEIRLTCGNMAAQKTGNGLYRCARSTCALPTSKSNSKTVSYFEFLLMQGAKSSSIEIGGVICGLCTKAHPLTALLGSTDGSLGVGSSGHIISFGKWKKKLPRTLSGGVVLGLGVELCMDGKSKMILFENGEKIGTSYEYKFPSNTKIYPAVTLLSNDPVVCSRFASSDLIPPKYLLDEYDNVYALGNISLKH